MILETTAERLMKPLRHTGDHHCASTKYISKRARILQQGTPLSKKDAALYTPTKNTTVSPV
jgi:hypothetical protein